MEHLAIGQISCASALINRHFPPKTAYTKGNSNCRAVPQTGFASRYRIVSQRVMSPIYPVVSACRKPIFHRPCILQPVTRTKHPKQGLTVEPVAISQACSGSTWTLSPIDSRLPKTVCSLIGRRFLQEGFPRALCPVKPTTGQTNAVRAKLPVRSLLLLRQRFYPPVSPGVVHSQ